MLWIDRLHNRKVMKPQERIVTRHLSIHNTDEVQVIWTNYLLHFVKGCFIFLIFSLSFGIFYTKCLPEQAKNLFVTKMLEMFQVIFSTIPTLRKMYKNKHIAILKGYHSIKVSSTPV